MLNSSGVPGEEEGGPGWLALGPPSSCRWVALKHAWLGPESSGDSGTQPWVTAHKLGSVRSSTWKPDLCFQALSSGLIEGVGVITHRPWAASEQAGWWWGGGDFRTQCPGVEDGLLGAAGQLPRWLPGHGPALWPPCPGLGLPASWAQKRGVPRLAALATRLSPLPF